MSPQLHTHAVVFNVTERDNDQHRAVQPRSHFASQQFATAIYQSELTYKLRQLGYEITKGRSGAPEIKGYTQEYRDASSPRSQQIRAYLERTGPSGMEAAEIAAHSTRDRKEIHSPGEVMAAHRKLAADFGHQADAVVRAAHERLQHPEKPARTVDHTFPVLVQRQDMTGAERSWASHYDIDDVVRYTRGSKAIGIGAGAYALLVAINPAANQVTVEKANNELATYDPRRLTGVSVYREIEREFSVGDRIQFTAPDKSLGVANRELAAIEAIHPDGRLSAQLDNNRLIDFNASEHRHFDHGYAVTSHSSQGSPPNASSFTPIPASTRTCSTLASATFPSPTPATRPRYSLTTSQSWAPSSEPMFRRHPHGISIKLHRSGWELG